ncbi:ATP-binding cassette domain-containing protein [Pseudonocardia sp. ICBG1293]|uniref:ATP-binding cassette domain-containing protein n=1 Tax=Pseudonocardia sp. ICBG1293 TaxID=2844382 RepID=UPI0027E0FE12|nr:ATP-binding cassette domain-containing protein [Pseudonocardia sp. ICBG1293]
MTPVLRAAGLSARTADGAVLLDGVDLELAAGAVLAVVGPSGAGKSTLGLALLGEANPGVGLAGSVRASGTELLGHDAAGLRSARAGRVGHLPQHPGTVLDPVRRTGPVLDELAAAACTGRSGPPRWPTPWTGPGSGPSPGCCGGSRTSSPAGSSSAWRWPRPW